MVCARCIKTVTGIFREAGIDAAAVELGKVTATNDIPVEKELEIRARLSAEGFEWLDDQKVKLVEKIKQSIIKLVHYEDLGEMKLNLSAHLSAELHKDYHYLSNVFSASENTTIEQYIILQKTERVKELL